MITGKRLDTLLTTVDHAIDDFLEALDAQSAGDAFGARSVDNNTFMAWFQMMTMVQYPPEPVVAPNGLVVTASPWLLALPYIEGGDKELRRYEDLRGVDMNWVRQLAGLSPRVTRTVKYLQGAQQPQPGATPVQQAMGRAA